ncbi:NUDIX domain-containing protein [Cellulomonas sp. URHD0024]|uniref:NUDIX hydrolase n=1 Tax=Cellulomonas sp. URHD0024 TaxID=1302620 RepID=UPI000417D3E6|nr:NUDIX domain-containing protein [Cellulomonas sp. URHD0024]
MSSPYRDSHGRTLEDYPRPSLAVDTAVLTVADERLCVLLARTTGAAGDTRLPGTFVHPGETLVRAVLRSLQLKAGVVGLRPRQLHVFDAPDRDDRGWVVSVAHLDAVRADRIPAHEQATLVPVDELPPLKYDHDEIVRSAVAALRSDYRRWPDPAALLPDGPFTVRDLRLLHELVLGQRLVADTFRRTMLPHLRAVGESRGGARGKPAELYLRAEQHADDKGGDAR